MSAEELCKAITITAKTRNDSITRVLRTHKINPSTFYEWHSGRNKYPHNGNMEKLYALYVAYTGKRHVT